MERKGVNRCSDSCPFETEKFTEPMKEQKFLI